MGIEIYIECNDLEAALALSQAIRETTEWDAIAAATSGGGREGYGVTIRERRI